MKRYNLIVFRVRHNLTQKEMAEKLGITRIHYTKIENGKNDPSFGLLEKFEKLFTYDDIWTLFKKS